MQVAAPEMAAFAERFGFVFRGHEKGEGKRPARLPRPLFGPEVYALHHRLVDVEGYVNVHGHRYSVPYLLIGRQLEVRETKDRIDLYQGPRLAASPAKVFGRTVTRVTVPVRPP